MTTTYPIDQIRADFPMLQTQMNGKPLVYLDTAATSLKPQAVIDRLTRFYSQEYGTVRRGAYALSQNSTAMFEQTRQRAAAFLGAERPEEIVFVRGVTEGMNLIAHAWGRTFLKPGDEILLTEMEHHSNIVPWQLVCEATGATIVVAPFDANGTLCMDTFRERLSPRTRLVSTVHVSNGLGTINPVAEIARLAHEVGAVMVVDGAQSTGHLPIDVQAIGCDFFVCSGHKMLGPTGVGLLYGRYDVLASMAPYQGGGEMIETVSFDGTTYDAPPHRFEAGTPPFAQVLGLGAAIDYLETIGVANIGAWEHDLLTYATERLEQVPGLRIVGTSPNKAGILGFTMDGIHPFDIGSVLDQEGIAIRVGQHCVQPVMAHFGIHSTARASIGPYTSKADIDALIAGLHTVRDLLA